MELNKIYNEDCRLTLDRIPDGSISLLLQDTPFGVTLTVIRLASGSNFSDIEEGGFICATSGFLNWVVMMKNVRSKNVTSHIAVISRATPCLFGLILAIVLSI